jgi:histidine phosphotransferase ChpT
MSADDLDLVALICSRLCHDLAGSIGAINNGVELLAEETDPAMRDEAFGLIAQSACDAARRLAFFRFALGASGGTDEPMGLEELNRVARDYFAGGKVAVSTPDATAQSLPKPLGKALLIGLALAAQALPRGGSMALLPNGTAWQIEAQGPMLRWTEEVAAALDGGAAPPREPHGAMACYAVRLAASVSYRLQAEPTATTLALRFAP